MSEASESEGAHLHLCLQPVWDVQLSGSATGGECWSVQPARPPSLPPHITTGRFSQASSPLMRPFYFPPPPLLCSTLGISFLGNTALRELERETVSRCLCKNVALTFNVNLV